MQKKKKDLRYFTRRLYIRTLSLQLTLMISTAFGTSVNIYFSLLTIDVFEDFAN